MRLGPLWPSDTMKSLKSWTALPNHIRIIAKAVSPIMKPRTPIQAETRWTRGFSSAAEAPSPILCRNVVKVNAKKKRVEKDKATAMKTGVDGPGPDNNREGAFPGRTVRLYEEDTVGDVQFRPAELWGREHDPSAPRKTLGPSTFVVWFEDNAVEGVTVRSATRSCNSTTGARNEKSDRSRAVNASKGARYRVVDLDRAEIIIIRTAVREERVAGVLHSEW